MFQKAYAGFGIADAAEAVAVIEQDVWISPAFESTKRPGVWAVNVRSKNPAVLSNTWPVTKGYVKGKVDGPLPAGFTEVRPTPSGGLIFFLRPFVRITDAITNLQNALDEAAALPIAPVDPLDGEDINGPFYDGELGAHVIWAETPGDDFYLTALKRIPGVVSAAVVGKATKIVVGAFADEDDVYDRVEAFIDAFGK